jgi:hypothetical protein
MAESRPGVEDITRPPDSTPDDIEVTNLDHFAHRLSLDVTNGAVSSASLTNGGVTSQSQSVTEYVTTVNASTSFEDCSMARKRRNPVGRIRNASRTFVKWLRFKSKSINHISIDRSAGVGAETADSSWRPWRKNCKSGRAEQVSV